MVGTGLSLWLSSKNPLAMQELQETEFRSLGQEDPLEEDMTTHSSSCLENPMDRGACRLQSTGLQRVRHDWSDLACTHTSFFRGPQGRHSEHSVPDLELDRAAALEKLVACAPARSARMWWISGRSQRQGETHSARCSYPAKQRCCTALLTEICFLSIKTLSGFLISVYSKYIQSLSLECSILLPL